MSTTLFSRLKESILRPEPQPTTIRVISVTGPSDYAELPQGFMRVVAASGKATLGYNCPAFLCFEVGTTVVVGRERVTLSVPREELPLVRLNFKRASVGASLGVIDTDELDSDGSVTWAGAPPSDGVGYR
jgi:hypothetical protein